jgi:hypothetical protein
VCHGIAFVVFPFTATRGGCHTCAIRASEKKDKPHGSCYLKKQTKKSCFFFEGNCKVFFEGNCRKVTRLAVRRKRSGGAGGEDLRGRAEEVGPCLRDADCGETASPPGTSAVRGALLSVA